MEEKAWEGEESFMTKDATGHQDAETLAYKGARVAAKVKLGSPRRNSMEGFAKINV